MKIEKKESNINKRSSDGITNSKEKTVVVAKAEKGTSSNKVTYNATSTDKLQGKNYLNYYGIDKIRYENGEMVLYDEENSLLQNYVEKYKKWFTEETQYVDFLEEKLMREIDEDEKEIIGKISKKYDELTNKETLVNQENFDLLRDKDENFIDKDIRIQDILYYCICVGVVGKSELEICEELLEACVKTKRNI